MWHAFYSSRWRQGSLAAVGLTLKALARKAREQEQRLLLECADELIAMTTSCDAKALAARLRPVRDQGELIQEAMNLLTHRRLPAARIARLETNLNLLKVRELLASLMASLSGAQTIAKLVKAGVFANENRIALISEETEQLRAAAVEAGRLVVQAEESLRDEKKRQLTTEQTRFAMGLITKAELASAI